MLPKNQAGGAIMTNRYRILLMAVVLLTLVLACSMAFTFDDPNKHFPVGYVPSGKQLYKEYCAACHGLDAQGQGPAAPSLIVSPPNLTTLAKRNAGTFPTEYVSNVIRFGPGVAAHGSSEMPVWGPIFLYLEHYNEAAVRQRIKNLCDFLESIQERNS
jgi:mono/diheme cytochrome c family protein